jgi:cytochrome c oxidase assembly protein subunit 15
VLVFIQIYLGALVAGLDAGLVFNEWPTMDNGFFPASQWDAGAGLAQFLRHAGDRAVRPPNLRLRRLAGRGGPHGVRWRWAPGSTHARRAAVLFGLVTLQAVFGIVTLLTYVPLGWALHPPGDGADRARLRGGALARPEGPLPLSDGSPHR